MKKFLFTFLSVPLFLSTPLLAQSEEADEEPPEIIEPAATVPSVVRNIDPAANPSLDEKISVNFPDTSLSQILLNYERLSGKRLIKDVNLAGQNMSIVVAEPVTKREAITIIEATLLLNSIALIPFGEDLLKVVNIQNGKNPRSEGVAIYTTLSALPEGDQVVSYFMTLKYRDAQQAAQELQQSFVPHPYGVIFPVPNAQAIIVTESTSVIRRLLELKELIDVPPARIISEFVPLIRADAERVAETITKMIDAQKNNNSGAAPPANNVPPVPQPNGEVVQQNFASGSSESSSNNLTAGQIQLTADTRTNRILVICRPTSFPYVKSLIQEFDRSVGLTEPLEMTLRYVKPSDVLQVLADLLTEDENDASASGGNAIQQPNAPRNTSQNRTASNSSNNRSGSSDSSSLSQPDSLEDPEADIGPESRIVGKTRIISDNKAGKILVIGPPESLEKVRGILERLDHKPQQVYLSTVIGQLRIRGDEQFGVDYLQSFLGGKGSGIAATGITTNQTAAFIGADALKLTSQLPVASGLSLYGTIADNLGIYVRALSSSNRFKVLSRPAVYASNNEKAVISSGTRIAVPTQTLTNNTLNNNNSASVTANIDYEEVVLKLEVVPQINSSNEVTMKIAQVNDSVNGSQTISGQTVPTIATQEIRTTVTVANKNVVILGGLVTESNTNDVNKIPILGDIPYLGKLFSSTTKNKDRNELLIFIQPNVVLDNADAQRESLGEEARSVVGEEGRSTAEGYPVPTPIRLQKYKK